MTPSIRFCQTCDHYPNDKHCIGCEWDKNTQGNTKWENSEEKEKMAKQYQEGYMDGFKKAQEIFTREGSK